MKLGWSLSIAASFLFVSVGQSYANSGVPLTVVFENSSPSLAHLDYYSPNFTITPAPDASGNVPYLSKTTFSAITISTPLSIQFGQYSAGTLLPIQPKCYYSFSLSGGTWNGTPSSGTTAQYCQLTSKGNNTFTLALVWPAPAAVNYSNVFANGLQVINGYLTGKTANPTALVANQAPLSTAQMNNFTQAIQANPSGNGWALQFGYDVIRLPLWLGAYYEQNAQGANTKEKQFISTYLTDLNAFISKNTCQLGNGLSVNSNGFWAYTISSVASDGARN